MSILQVLAGNRRSTGLFERSMPALPLQLYSKSEQVETEGCANWQEWIVSLNILYM